MAIGMRSSSASGKTMSTTTAATGTDTRQQQEDGGDAVTIAVETGLSEWLSMDYVSGQPPESIIVQRIQEFAMSRRDHEQYYSIDWKYQAKDRTLPSWPESREEMQARLERSLAHVLLTYTGNGNSNNKYKDYDLSIVFVTHASPVNALLEACLETPILVPVPNCSISRCRWTLISSTDSSQEHTTNDNDKDSAASGLPNVLVQSMRTHTIAGEDGRWLLDYQTHTSHLDRDRR
ncbi:MAG: hypothetical protein J3R72DRAFT_448411 [Linnemannia gamsii]|nr:MAG: hypothetical protein J3R72DRAFT_448411 [Linnemannia gamsii]